MKRESVPLAESAKRSFDFTFTLIIMLFILPLFVIIMTAALLLQGRPVIYRQYRIGRGGARFPCFKIRTMVRDADLVLESLLAKDPSARLEWESCRKLKKDPRVTSIGSLLRKTSMDELPQLWNVIKGDMSLVGPRPIVENEIAFYGASINNYYKVRPGLTGLWQILGRSDTSYDARVAMDDRYVREKTFLGDISILTKTVPAVLKMRGSC